MRHIAIDSSGSGKTTDRSDITSGQFLELVPGRCLKQSVTFESSDSAFAGEMTIHGRLRPHQEERW